MSLVAAVHVYVTSADRTRAMWLKPGDEVPDWARVDARNLQPGGTASDAAGPEEGGVREPPRAGRGSGLEAWLRFAEAHGVGVDSGMSRDDVIAACEAAEVVTSEG